VRYNGHVEIGGYNLGLARRGARLRGEIEGKVVATVQGAGTSLSVQVDARLVEAVEPGDPVSDGRREFAGLSAQSCGIVIGPEENIAGASFADLDQVEVSETIGAN